MRIYGFLDREGRRKVYTNFEKAEREFDQQMKDLRTCCEERDLDFGMKLLHEEASPDNPIPCNNNSRSPFKGNHDAVKTVAVEFSYPGMEESSFEFFAIFMIKVDDSCV